MTILRFIWLGISFLAVEVFIFLPLYLVGLLAFPIAYHFASLTVKESYINTCQDVLGFKNRVLDEWLGNREDGLLPAWWQKERNGTAYGWFLRNPVCNMRFWPYISTFPNSERMKWIGTIDHIGNANETGWFLCWQGLYTGFWYQGKYFGCWVGWKCSPRDRFPDAPRDYRYCGLGIACQLWKAKN